MPRHTEPSQPEERHRRFRDTIAAIYAHQPAAVLRALAHRRTAARGDAPDEPQG